MMVHANSVFLETFSPSRVSSFDTSLLQPAMDAEPHPFAMAIQYVYAQASSADPDTMTFHEAMKAPDKDKFIIAMHKELNDHVERKHWKIVPMRSIPNHKRAIPMVWSMKRKRDPLGIITKWKARLCAGGHRSIENVDYSQSC